MSTAISPDRILNELAKLWRELGRNLGHEGSHNGAATTADNHDSSGNGEGALRASTMTLLALSEEREDPAALGETLAQLMRHHPARAIVVRLHGAKEHVLSERVSAQCWTPAGQRRQICCEHIEITASDDALAGLPPVLLPLIAADLPRVLWCRSPRMLFAPEFAPLRAMADKLIVDSAEIRVQWMFGGVAIDSSARTALHELSRIVDNGAMLGDLAWTRLTRWREAVAHLFDTQQSCAGLGGISQITVATNGEPGVSALYLGAWVMDSLKAAGFAPHFRMERDGESPMALRLGGECFTAEITARDGRLVSTVNGVSTFAAMPDAGEYALMNEELCVMRRDKVFEATLPSAVKLASATWQ